jgi:hypothetical protein
MFRRPDSIRPRENSEFSNWHCNEIMQKSLGTGFRVTAHLTWTNSFYFRLLVTFVLLL